MLSLLDPQMLFFLNPEKLARMNKKIIEAFKTPEKLPTSELSVKIDLCEVDCVCFVDRVVKDKAVVRPW